MEENINSVQTENQVIQLTPTVKQDFISSAKWGKFFAILCFVGAGIMLIASIVMLCVGSVSSEIMEDAGVSELLSEGKELTSTVTAVIYIICAVVCAVVGWFLYKASKNIGQGVNTDNQDTIAIGMHNLKTFCQIYGVISIISLAIALLTIIGSLVVVAVAGLV